MFEIGSLLVSLYILFESNVSLSLFLLPIFALVFQKQRVSLKLVLFVFLSALGIFFEGFFGTENKVFLILAALVCFSGSIQNSDKKFDLEKKNILIIYSVIGVFLLFSGLVEVSSETKNVFAAAGLVLLSFSSPFLPVFWNIMRRLPKVESVFFLCFVLVFSYQWILANQELFDDRGRFFLGVSGLAFAGSRFLGNQRRSETLVSMLIAFAITSALYGRSVLYFAFSIGAILIQLEGFIRDSHRRRNFRAMSGMFGLAATLLSWGEVVELFDSGFRIWFLPFFVFLGFMLFLFSSERFERR